MKKTLGVAFAFLIVFLAACGSNDTSTNVSEGDQENAENETVNNEDKSSAGIQETKKEKENKQKEYDQKTGEGYVEGLGYVKTLGVGYSDEVGIDGTDSPLKPLEFGSMELTINHMEIAEIQPNADNEVLFDGRDKAKVIIVDMKAENKSDEDIEFYPDGSILVTDTGLQLEDSDVFLGEEVGGEFYGKVKKEGMATWILDDDVEKINSVKMIIDPAWNMDQSIEEPQIGEEKRIEFDILNQKDAYKKDKEGGMEQ
ncbi:hypothetical protein F3157_07915 [Virgibacillus dakarensis]|nr:hypothetical protein [Virgibacillus dakarensis]